MYYRKFIDFLKNHGLYDENVFKYWLENRFIFDYLDEEYQDFIGVFYKIDEGYLTKMSILVPHINDDITLIINIHEYVHLFLMYKKLGKKCKIGRDCEVLPIFFEMLYIRENESPELIKYRNKTCDIINNSGNDMYLLALKLSDNLLEYYDSQEVNKLDSKVKRLVLKHDIKKAFNI